MIRATRARNNITDLPHNTSLLVVRAALPQDRDIIEKDGLRLFSLATALIACAPGFYRQQPTEMRAALSMVRDASEVLNRLLEGGHSTIAGRLAGAFRNIGQDKIADEIIKTMRAAGYTIREEDPFETNSPLILTTRETTPIINRIRLMWQQMRPTIIEQFPPAPGITANIKTYLKHIEDIYVTDAYHSLSIEGYRVSAELIERVRSGNWNPDLNENDREHRNALAARGYWLAHNAVRESIKKILQGHDGGNNAGTVVKENHRDWYRELFTPSVTAGILQAADLAGYRNVPVYIRRSAHVPPRSEAVPDAMSALFNCLREETEACVRVVLGHFIFVYIHPYMDGNGRIGRFMMNAMLASGGYTWCIVPVEQRNAYMAALESASVDQNIKPFAVFLSRLITTQQNTNTP